MLLLFVLLVVHKGVFFWRLLLLLLLLLLVCKETVPAPAQGNCTCCCHCCCWYLQVIVAGAGERGGVVVLVDTLAPPGASTAATLASPRGATPTSVALVHGAVGGGGAAPGAVLVVGDDAGWLRGYDPRVLAETRPLWEVRPHVPSAATGKASGVTDASITCLAAWDPVLLHPPPGMSGGGAASSAAAALLRPTWLSDVVAAGGSSGSIALVNALTGAPLQLMRGVHHRERRGLLERVVGQGRAGRPPPSSPSSLTHDVAGVHVGGSSSSSSSAAATAPLCVPVLAPESLPTGASLAAITGLETCSEGLLSCGADGVLRFHALQHALDPILEASSSSSL
jgi:hypothetical protein